MREPPKGWMDDKCMAWLRRAGTTIKGVGVEMGSYHGRSTSALVEQMPQGAVLYCIDNWLGAEGDPDQQRGYDGSDAVYLAFCKNLAPEIKAGRVVPLRMDTVAGANEVLNARGAMSVDFMFIDADHRYEAVKRDIVDARMLVRPGGLIAGHDYSTKRWVGVKRAADEAFGADVQRGPGSIWFVRLQ